MRRALLMLPLALLATPLAAQPSGLAETLLHIGETAEVTRAPDEVTATLRAEARAGTAAAVQDAVNRTIAAAVARAQATPGIRVATGSYWTSRIDEGRSWQATQSLTLRGADPTKLLELAGALQGQGLALGGLSFGLTREAHRTARQEASAQALEALQKRAEAVAAQLGLQLVGLREVRIDAAERHTPRPMAAPMARAAASPAAAPPVAVAEDVVVGAGVEAVAVLRPR
jgi:predicted secreted protein